VKNQHLKLKNKILQKSIKNKYLYFVTKLEKQ